jgi:ribonuclease Z
METLNVAGVTLEGFAQGGLRTSIVVPEVKAIFDVGHIVRGALRHKNIFITHGHPDHMGALITLIGRRDVQQLDEAQVHVPHQISGWLVDMFEAWRKIQGGRRIPINILGHKPGDRINLKHQGMVAIAAETYHRIPSIGWVVERTTKKLKPEFVGLEGSEIGKLKKEGHEITDESTAPILAIPGDTTIDFLIKQPLARKSRVLVHEVTIWDDHQSIAKCRRFGHTHIDEMVEHCDKFEGEALVLCHRTMRMKRTEIEAIAKKKFPSSMLEKIHFFDGGDRILS